MLTYMNLSGFTMLMTGPAQRFFTLRAEKNIALKSFEYWIIYDSVRINMLFLCSFSEKIREKKYKIIFYLIKLKVLNSI